MKKEKLVFTSQDLKELEKGKDLLKNLLYEDLKKEVLKKGFQELKKEKLIKDLRKKQKENKSSLSKELIKQERKNNIEKKSLENFSIYKTNLNYNSGLLESYTKDFQKESLKIEKKLKKNFTKKEKLVHKEKLLNFQDWEKLESLYNTLLSYTTWNWKASKDLFNLEKYLFNNNIVSQEFIKSNSLGKVFTLNELIDLESVLSYFINNITAWKLANKRIKRQYIIQKLLNKTKDYKNFKDLNENIESEKDLKELINISFILEKLNFNWSLEKLLNLQEQKSENEKQYKQIRESLKIKYKNFTNKNELIKQEKEKAFKEYLKIQNNINNKIKTLKASIKIDYYK